MSQIVVPTYTYPQSDLARISPLESPYEVYLGVFPTPQNYSRAPRPFLPHTPTTIEYFFELSKASAFELGYNGNIIKSFTNPPGIFTNPPYNFDTQIPFLVNFPAYSSNPTIDVPFDTCTVSDDLGFNFTLTSISHYFYLDRYCYLNIGPTVTGDTPIPIDTSVGVSRGTYHYLARYPSFDRGGTYAAKTISLQIDLLEGQTLDIDPTLDDTASVLVISPNLYYCQELPTTLYGTRKGYLAHQNETATLHVGSNLQLPEDLTFDLLLVKTQPKQVYAAVGTPLQGGYWGDLLYYPHSLTALVDNRMVCGSFYGTMKFIDKLTWSTTEDLNLQSSYYNYYDRCFFASDNENIYVHATQRYGAWPFPSEIYCLQPSYGPITNGWNTILMGHITGENNNYGGMALDKNYLYVALDGSANIYKYDRTTYAKTLITSKTTGAPVDGAFGVAKINLPGAMWRDPNSDWLYFSDSTTIRRLNVTNNSIQTIAGAYTSYYGYREGVGTASLWGPQAGGMDGDGSTLYVADTYNAVIRSINLTTFETSLVAGIPPIVDGTGRVQSTNSGFVEGNRLGECQFSQPRGLVLGDGGLYVADPSNMIIWKITLP
jgi:hypothetical protein